jgi:hypothetical protein
MHFLIHIGFTKKLGQFKQNYIFQFIHEMLFLSCYF